MKVKCSIPKYTLEVFHNGSNYNYDFIIMEIAKQFQGELRKHVSYKSYNLLPYLTIY